MISRDAELWRRLATCNKTIASSKTFTACNKKTADNKMAVRVLNILHIPKVVISRNKHPYKKIFKQGIYLRKKTSVALN